MIVIEGERRLTGRGHRRLEEFALKWTPEASKIEICDLLVEAVQCGPWRRHSG